MILRKPNRSSARRLVRKLSSYAATAAAVMVGESCGAAIVHVDLSDGQSLNGFHLDFDLDGVEEYSFESGEFDNVCITVTTFSGGTTQSCREFGSFGFRATATGRTPKAKILGDGLEGHRLAFGDEIDFAQPRFQSALLAEHGTFVSSSPACDVGVCTFYGGEFLQGQGFLGLVFELPSSGLHAGWAELDAGRIYGFAYETLPGQPIDAGAVPEPPSLLLMAAGATGLAALRRRRNQSS